MAIASDVWVARKVASNLGKNDVYLARFSVARLGRLDEEASSLSANSAKPTASSRRWARLGTERVARELAER